MHDWQKEDRIMSEPSLSAPIILDTVCEYPSMIKCGVFPFFVSGRQLGPAVRDGGKALSFHLVNQLSDAQVEWSSWVINTFCHISMVPLLPRIWSSIPLNLLEINDSYAILTPSEYLSWHWRYHKLPVASFQYTMSPIPIMVRHLFLQLQTATDGMLIRQ